MAEKAVYSEFDEKTQLILKSRKNSNLIVDLLVYLDNKNEDHIVKTISCLKRVFMKHLSKRLWHQAFENARQFTHVSDGDLDSAIGDGDSSLKFPPKDHVADDNNAEMVFAKWIHEKYLDFVRKLLDFLGTKETHVEKATLDSLMELLFADHKAIVSSKFQKLSYYFPNTLFYKIISHMLHGGNGQEDLIEYFANQYLSYDDIKFYCMKNIQSILATKTDKEDIFNKQIAFTFISNIYSFLKSISPPKEDNESLNLFVNTNINESTAQDILGSKEFSKKFSAAWLSFLRLHLPPIIQKKVLLNLHTKVMPFLDDPKLLVDFLTDSYNVKGATSLLALNGLFILIHQYNLDYPEFYKKLYNLFDASVFHSKYKDRFFHLSDLFLSSTHLPSYLVAAFIKRLARLSLTAPPDGIRIIITFIENLLKRHPSCKTLIHRKQKPSENPEEVPRTDDPYVFDEQDPAKCNALKSSLWELKTLQSHYLPDIVKAIDTFYKPFNKEEVDVSTYLETDYFDLFDKECANYSEDEKIPMAFKPPRKLFDDTFFSQGEWCIGT